MFIENKYTKIYFSLMEKAKLRDNLIVFEKHHIIPKSLGGSNKYNNIVKLSPREHFISHALLTKMVKDKRHKRAMSYAFVRMKTTNNKSKYTRIGNGKLYEILRNSIRENYSGENNPYYGNHGHAGINNPFYGKTHTKEAIEKIKKANENNFGENNPFYGKTHTKKTKDLISKMQSESVVVIFTTGKKVLFDKKSDIGKYLGVSKPMGIQLCSIKRHLWGKYNIKEILDEHNVNQKNSN